MRPIELPPYLPRTDAPPLARASRPAWETIGDSPAPGIILTRTNPTGRLPFLAQYLAQEVIGDETQPRWRERDSAYRLADNPPSPARLTIDI